MTLHRVGGIIRLPKLDLPTLLKVQPDVWRTRTDLDASLDVNLQDPSQSSPNVVFLLLIIIVVFRQRIYFQQSPTVIQIWVGAIASRSGVAS
jgi:hypothetical protein